MQPAKDAAGLPPLSESVLPIGPNSKGEILYVHVGPLSPLTSTPSRLLAPALTHREPVVALVVFVGIAILAFLTFYFYPVIANRVQSVGGAETFLSTDTSRRSRFSKPSWLPSFSRALADEKRGAPELPTSQLLDRRRLPSLQLARPDPPYLRAHSRKPPPSLSPTSTLSTSTLSPITPPPRIAPSARIVFARAADPTTPVKTSGVAALAQDQEMTNRSPSKESAARTAGDVEAQC
ncbi:hypothetical protein FA95DRAFT_1557120 [Auriscalpium vulgare]|uniref:Uncharacterized protein n=1 Tax=Auriscalpium vulgare TaxID=40419 RepID=A0ACB8RYC6_9AGAM|nr:hypothetical protein FA95DRAFT_1557120 [Auriscalpium vulgare]